MSESKRPALLKGPSFSPDCQWEPMAPESSVPENALYRNGELHGKKVYVGRVSDGDCVYVGTAIPEKSTCVYLDKSLQVKSTSNYEILTIEFGDPLWFVEASSLEKDQYNQFVAGIYGTEEVLYVGRYIDNNYNTYYGWLLKDFERVFIPRDPSEGPQVLDKDFSVLIHRSLHMMCTGCPVPITDVD